MFRLWLDATSLTLLRPASHRRRYVVVYQPLLVFIFVSAIIITVVDNLTGTVVEAGLLEKVMHTTIRMLAGAMFVYIFLWIGE